MSRLARSPRYPPSAASSSSPWQFGIVSGVTGFDPTPQLSVSVGLHGQESAGLEDAPTETVSADSVHNGSRAFHPLEVVGVRNRDGNWEVSKLMQVAALYTKATVGHVFVRVYSNAWYDQAVDVTDIRNYLDSLPSPTPAFRTSNALGTGYFYYMDNYSTSVGFDRLWPFVGTGQTADVIVGDYVSGSPVVVAATLAAPPGYETGSVYQLP